MGRPFKCPCGASDSAAKGFRKTKTMGVRRIRRCRKCGRKFTPKHQRPVKAAEKPDASAATARARAQKPSRPSDDADAELVL